MNNSALQDSQIGWLLLDLNSFFASCEQQEQPHLRGKPIAIVPMMNDSTCAIAASAEAKKFGIKTGTGIREAKQRCPDLVLVKARHKIYIEYHHRIIAAVESCIPVTKVLSVDEMACRLERHERDMDVARALAHKVKRTLYHQVGECLTCSIGLAPNMFLAKLATDMQKPDGLVVITKNDLPHKLHGLKLMDICGIGRRMEARLNRAGIWSVKDLMAAPRAQLRAIWGGIQGALFYEMVHGADLQYASASTHTQSMSHQHVLEPRLRSIAGAADFSHHLLAKAAERLRRNDYYCRRLGLQLAFVSENKEEEKNNWGNWAGWGSETSFPETQDTDYLLARLNELWREVAHPRFRRLKPIKVGVVLMGLVPITQHQPDLFAPVQRVIGRTEKPAAPINHVVDALNAKFGRNTIGFGIRDSEIKKFAGHAAFQRVPDIWEF